MKLSPVASACKARAANDYGRFDTFVECYDDQWWNEFVIDFEGKQMDQGYAFTLMDDMADVWDERKADAVNSAF